MDHPTREEFEKLKREVEDLKHPEHNTSTEIAFILAGAAVSITAIIGFFWF